MVRQRIKMRMRSYDHRALNRAVSEITGTVLETGARVFGPIALPRKIKKFVLLRSPHIDKKARDQFEIRTHNRLLEIECSPQTLEALKALTIASQVKVEIIV